MESLTFYPNIHSHLQRIISFSGSCGSISFAVRRSHVIKFQPARGLWVKLLGTVLKCNWFMPFESSCFVLFGRWIMWWLELWPRPRGQPSHYEWYRRMSFWMTTVTKPALHCLSVSFYMWKNGFVYYLSHYFSGFYYLQLSLVLTDTSPRAKYIFRLYILVFRLWV